MILEKSLITYLTESVHNSKIDLDYIERMFSYKASEIGISLNIKKDKIKSGTLINVRYTDCLVLYGSTRYKKYNQFIITCSSDESSIIISVKLLKERYAVIHSYSSKPPLLSQIHDFILGINRQTKTKINYFESAEEEKYLDFIEETIEKII